MYKTDFKPIAKRNVFLMKLIFLAVDFSFLARTFAAHSMIDLLLSLLATIFLFCLFIYMNVVIPTAIYFGKSQLIIKRTFNKKYIPYSSIQQVIPYNEVQNDIRHLGSNGFLGYIGVMESTQYGKYYSYVKDSSQQVFVLTTKHNYLFSCENRESFIAELNKKII